MPKRNLSISKVPRTCYNFTDNANSQCRFYRVERLTKTQVMKAMLLDMGLGSSQCMMVGDSITDLTAARDNGVPFIGVSYGYGADGITDADVLVHDTVQLQAEIYRFSLYSCVERDIASLRRPTVIGINGVDASGKTLFALGLGNYLRRRGIHIAIIHADDFHNPRAVRSADDSPEGYIKYAFDTAKMAGLIIELKRAPKTISLDLLDLDTDTFTNSKTFDEVLHRANERDVPKYGKAFLQRYIDRYIPAQKLYLSEYAPKDKSQLIIDNNDYQRPLALGNCLSY